MGNYIQPLWQQVGPAEASSEIYNGAVEAAATLHAAGLAFRIELATKILEVFTITERRGLSPG